MTKLYGCCITNHQWGESGAAFTNEERVECAGGECVESIWLSTNRMCDGGDTLQFDWESEAGGGAVKNVLGGDDGQQHMGREKIGPIRVSNE